MAERRVRNGLGRLSGPNTLADGVHELRVRNSAKASDGVGNSEASGCSGDSIEGSLTSLWTLHGDWSTRFHDGSAEERLARALGRDVSVLSLELEGYRDSAGTFAKDGHL